MSNQSKTNSMNPVAVVAGARTPFCKAFTDFQDVSAVQLGRHALLESLQRSGVAPDQVDEVVFGNVAGPPDAANVSRVIALESGIPMDRIAHTVNRNCASGIESIISGWQSIAQGRSQIVVAGGTESMSQIPLLWSQDSQAVWSRLAKSKTLLNRIAALCAFRPRHFKPVPGIQLGLTDPVSGLNMGQTAEVLAKEFGISRQAQDQFALASHQKASAAQQACFLSGEIVPYRIANDRTIERDNGIRHDQSMEALAKLRPIFDPQGTVTAGNSCQITDGAAAVVMMPVDAALRDRPEPLGFITAYAIAGCDPKRMGLGPVYAVDKLLRQTGLTLNDFDLVEINEAFAAQVLACLQAMESKSFAERELERTDALGRLDPERLNVHGGAIAIGHPVGTTGTRLVLTLLRALRASGKRRGLVTLCVGGGQGVAIVVETSLKD